MIAHSSDDDVPSKSYEELAKSKGFDNYEEYINNLKEEHRIEIENIVNGYEEKIKNIVNEYEEKIVYLNNYLISSLYLLKL